MESVLELPGSVAHFVRVPKQDELPPGPLATLRLDPQLLQLGLATPEDFLGGFQRNGRTGLDTHQLHDFVDGTTDSNGRQPAER